MVKTDSRIIQKRIIELKREGNSATDIRKILKIPSEFDYQIMVLAIQKELGKKSKNWLKYEYDDSKRGILWEVQAVLDLGEESHHSMSKKIKPFVKKNFDIQKFKASMKYQKVWGEISSLHGDLFMSHWEWVFKTKNMFDYLPKNE